MRQSGLARRMLALAALCIAVLGIVAGIAQGSNRANSSKSNEHNGSYTIGLFGDMPYNAMGKADYPYLLQDINSQNVRFSTFDGDLKAGGDGPCSDSLYTTAIAGFNSLKHPLIWVPGDNDWTDCWGRYGPGHSRIPIRSSAWPTNGSSSPRRRAASARRRSSSPASRVRAARTRSTRRTCAGRAARWSTSG